jgi:hypothetical protein
MTLHSAFGSGSERRPQEIPASSRTPTHARPAGFFTNAWRALAQSHADGGLFLWPAAIGFWILVHGFRGITADASLYVARALADLDPAGLGRDMAFVYDGQSRFSLFPLVLRHLVAILGTGLTADVLAIAATAAWLVALTVLLRQFLPTRFVPLSILCVALLPSFYGSAGIFHYAEVLAIPRPFAESLALFALWALAAGHSWRAFALLVGATLLHPIMALAGWAVFGLVLCREDRRWWFAALVIGAAVIAAGVFGLPVARRLVMPVDADLRAFATYRVPYLFPVKWPLESFGPVLIEAVTLAIAASFFEGRRRAILIATIAAGVGGLIAQIVFGDFAGLLLVIQAQLWRMAWLLAALGAAMLGVAAFELWQRGPRGHIVLAGLCIAWLIDDHLLLAAPAALVIVLFHFGPRSASVQSSWTPARALWAAAAALALLLGFYYLAAYGELVRNIPQEHYYPGEFLWGDSSLAFMLMGLMLTIYTFVRGTPVLSATRSAAALGVVAAALTLWDSRPAFQRMFDAGHHPAALTALIASRPGEILWIGGLAEGWLLAGRPQWASRQQGSGTIFSRALTLEWRRRMQFLMAHGLAERDAIVAFHVASAREMPRLTRDGVRALCTRQDAPAWIIAPVMADVPIPTSLKPRYWQLENPNFIISKTPSNFEWHRVSAYAVLPCAGSKV